MKASETEALKFLKDAPQLVVPIYQRTYSWTETECRQLWDDLLKVGHRNSSHVHFIGSVVCIADGLGNVRDRAPLLVIDGQQRLTTLTLILTALAEHLDDKPEVAGFSAKKIRNRYLIDPLEEGDGEFKLMLTQTDRDSLIALVAGRELPSSPSLRIVENTEFFREKIKNLEDQEQLEALCFGLNKLVFVDIALNRDTDNAQLIFESMNSTGRELSQADLIRNFVLMGLKPNLQSKLYKSYWRPMELEFGQQAYAEEFDDFVRHWLTWKGTGDVPRKHEVYKEFKSYALEESIKSQGDEALVADLRKGAKFYGAFALGKEKDPELKRAFNDLRELKVNVSYPLLIELYDDFGQGNLSRDDLLTMVRLIESYVFRRAIVGIGTNSMNKTFATFTGGLSPIDKSNYLEQFQAKLLSLTAQRAFPSDAEFTRALTAKDMYAFNRLSYWLRRMENFDRKERIAIEQFTVEHIMPQNPNPKWQSYLGDDWEAIHQRHLHSVGNLTLSGNNSALGDKPFETKRDMKNGLGDSPLRLNRGLNKVEQWNEAAIVARGEQLARRALNVWGTPSAPAEAVEHFNTRKRTYSNAWSPIPIDDHRHLTAGSKTRELFDLLSDALLALNDQVYREAYKSYVAFKADQNFLDVSTRSGWLQLYTYIPPSELIDDEERCEDVSQKGRPSAGTILMPVRNEDDIPYAIGIARQSLERQLDA